MVAEEKTLERALERSARRLTTLRIATALAAVSAVLLAGCSPSPPSSVAQDQAAAPTPEAQQDDVAEPSPVRGTVGGDGSDIQLDALSERDLREADLSGELACSFSVGGVAPILFATGIVASDEPAQGVVKVSGYVEPIRAPGGFDGMIDGATFTGQGKSIELVTTGEAIGGGESPPYPARLTYQRADGASRTFDGRWQCGP